MHAAFAGVHFYIPAMFSGNLFPGPNLGNICLTVMVPQIIIWWLEISAFRDVADIAVALQKVSMSC